MNDYYIISIENYIIKYSSLLHKDILIIKGIKINMKQNNNYFKIKRSLCLNGTIMIDGAKNALLPIMIASLLTHGVSYIHGVPDIYDLHSTIYLLSLYNVFAEYDRHTRILTIDTTNIKNNRMHKEHFLLLRTSVLFLSAMLQNFNEFWLLPSGGDAIGKRPVDIHINGLQVLGVTVTNNHDSVYLQKNENAVFREFYLPFPSVGATANLLIYAAKNEGVITLYNVATEPEIMELIEVLRAMGARIECFFGGTIVIYGTVSLNPFTYYLMPDRLEAATFLIAAAMTGGSIFLPNMPIYTMRSCLSMLQRCGHEIELGNNGYGVTCHGRIDNQKNNEIISIKTMPYPGFSTDYQPLFLSLLTITKGMSYIYENIFEKRFLHIDLLNNMGACIVKLYDNVVSITGVDRLVGRSVSAPDIRSGASLILAGLVADEETVIYGTEHILRGYSKIEKKLQSVGAEIYWCQDFSMTERENNCFHETKKDLVGNSLTC